jgi:hypothetical protein
MTVSSDSRTYALAVRCSDVRGAVGGHAADGPYVLDDVAQTLGYAGPAWQVLHLSNVATEYATL